jgi:hypothetical protein
LVQPYQHHTNVPAVGINVYSFALKPEEHQPSGTCNFSRIDSATLSLTLSNRAVSSTSTAQVRVYAVNYNVLRIMSGINKKLQKNKRSVVHLCPTAGCRRRVNVRAGKQCFRLVA